MQTITAKLKYLNIAPRKTRAVADLIRGLTVNEAEAQLLHLERRASESLLKLLRSAVANAKHNEKLDSSLLYIKEIRVDGGPKVKRWMPRARGSVSPIERKMSHVSITLGISDRRKEPRFTIQEKPKKEKQEKVKKREGRKREELREKKPLPEVKPQRKLGFFQRVFRRKSI